MPSIKGSGMRWFRENIREDHNHDQSSVKVSKYHSRAPANPSRDEWWLDVPEYVIKEPIPDHVHILCERQPGADSFYHLKVPKAVFAAAVERGTVNVTRKRDVRLELLAEPASRFLDRRGTGKLDLRPYLQ